MTAKIDFEVVPPDVLDDLREEIGKVGQLGTFGEPTIDINVGFARDALVDVFSEPNNEVLRAKVRAAYSRAVHVAFGKSPRLIAFFDHKKGRLKNGSDARMTEWHIKITEQMMAKNITFGYGTFSDQLAEIHKKVFLKVGQLGGNTPEQKEVQRTKLADDMQKRLRALGGKMGWVNKLQFDDEPHDFTMAAFAQMISPADRFGGIAMHYAHPISQERLTLRVDDVIAETADLLDADDTTV